MIVIAIFFFKTAKIMWLSLASLMGLTLLLSQSFALNEIDFKSAVKVFFRGKSANFCSKENLKIMYEIEAKKQQEREMARQMKRMESEIIRNILKMMGGQN